MSTQPSHLRIAVMDGLFGGLRHAGIRSTEDDRIEIAEWVETEVRALLMRVAAQAIVDHTADAIRPGEHPVRAAGREELRHVIELWHPQVDAAIRVIAKATEEDVAKAAFQTAIPLYRGRRIILREGKTVIAEHRGGRLDAGR